MKPPINSRARDELKSNDFQDGRWLRNHLAQTGEGSNDMEDKIAIYGTNW
jgi:hypothetical protein